MQMVNIVFSAAIAAATAARSSISTQHVARYGPANCISLWRSSQATCVIATACGDQDLSATDFAFDCTEPQTQGGGVVRHSFGQGGFDAHEEYDSGVGPCDTCAAPVAALAAPVAQNAEAATEADTENSQPTAATQEVAASSDTSRSLVSHAPEAPAPETAESSATQSTQVKNDASSVQRYGPNGCFSTYKHNEHCIIKTECTGVEITNYEVGLVCVDKDGSSLRHLFGRDSFDNEETFDTLIVCEKCLALDTSYNGEYLAGAVKQLSTEVQSLAHLMANLTSDVTALNEAVFNPTTAAPPPVQAPAAAPMAASPAAFVHRAVGHRKARGINRRNDQTEASAPAATRRAHLRHPQAVPKVEMEDTDDGAEDDDNNGGDPSVLNNGGEDDASSDTTVGFYDAMPTAQADDAQSDTDDDSDDGGN